MNFPADLTGNHPLVPWLNQTKRAAQERALKSGVGYRIAERNSGGTSLEVIASNTVAETWPPIELDATTITPQGAWRYIDSANTLVTIGLTDLNGGSNFATAGLWRALKTVPASSGGSYNVPQDPLPTGGISGANAYWILIKPLC
jgi:hypothetical protein